MAVTRWFSVRGGYNDYVETSFVCSVRTAYKETLCPRGFDETDNCRVNLVLTVAHASKSFSGATL